MDPDIQITVANEISSQLERDVVQKLQSLKRMEKVAVLTHMEPARVVKKQHAHAMLRPVLPGISQSISDTISTFKDVVAVKQLDVLQEDNGYYISTIVLIDGTKTVQQAHAIADRLEHLLFSKIQDLKRCIIHTEPLMH